MEVCDGMGKKVVDFHTHVVPRIMPDFCRRYGYGGFVSIDHDQSKVETSGNARLLRDSEFYMEIAPNCWDLEMRVQEMNQAGIDIQVLSTLPEMFSYWARADDAADLARIINNDMAEQIKRFPDRFVGLGTVPLQAPELAIAELHRCMKELGFAGVVVGTHINEWNLDAPEMIAFWEAAEDLDACVFIHPNLDTKSEDQHLLPRLVGMSAEMCHSVTCFLTSGTLEKFPKLKVCFAHGAGTFPYIRGQLEHGLQTMASSPLLRESAENLSPRQYNGRFYCDSIVQSREATQFLLNSMSEEMVVFGSDYPLFAASQKYSKLLYNDYLEEQTIERVMGLNALKFLGMTKEEQEQEQQEIDDDEQHNDQPKEVVSESK